MVVVVVNPWKGKYGGLVSEIIGYNNKKQKHNANLMKNNKSFTVQELFNLIPVPPLDGWGILTQLFNLERYSWWYKVYQYGQWILLLLIFANITDLILGPAVNAIMHLLVF